MKTLLLKLAVFCTLSLTSQNTAYLDINEVKAIINNYNSIHWDLFGAGASRYEVPKGSGKHANFASGIWFGGLDNGNQLHVAAQTYLVGRDFSWGPLDTTTGVNNDIGAQYIRIWKLNRADIDSFTLNFANGNVQTGAYVPVPDLLNWPANPYANFSKKLAPYFDLNSNGTYDPMVGGDYPKIKGDQAIYFIFNDNGGVHGKTGGLPFGIEIHGMAYAYGPGNKTNSFPQLAYTTFYNYRIINRSSNDYNNMYISIWSDVDVGYYGDDFIGSNVEGNYAYGYNGDATDETIGSIKGYEANPPAAGFQILKGPYAPANDGIDNDNDGVIDESCEQNLMNALTYFNNSFTGIPIAQTDPDNAIQFYQYMTGYWKDGLPFTCGGNAYGGAINTKFVYPGSSYSTGPCGTEIWNDPGPPGDRRYILSSGPFNFKAHTEEEVEYAYVTSFDSVTNDPVTRLMHDMEAIKVFSNTYDSFMPCNSITSISETSSSATFNLYPNPANNTISIKTTKKINGTTEIIDMMGNILLSKTTENTNYININLDQLADGLYFLKLKVDGKSITKKFMKQ